MVIWKDVELFSITAFGPRHHDTKPARPPLILLRTCFVLAGFCFVTVTLDLDIALWWSLYANEFSSGFTMAGYVVTLGGIIMPPISSTHGRGCTCWMWSTAARDRMAQETE